jgi:hypothetical protein
MISFLIDASKNKRNIGNAAKGKQFKEDYNLLSYKLVFQLALKQDNVVYISHITCETNTIDERKFLIINLSINNIIDF